MPDSPVVNVASVMLQWEELGALRVSLEKLNDKNTKAGFPHSSMPFDGELGQKGSDAARAVFSRGPCKLFRTAG